MAVKEPKNQHIVADTVTEHFGRKSLTSLKERSARFGEEAIELLQSVAMPEEEVIALVKYVYNRPPGLPSQEIGGVGVTLYGLAENLSLDCDECIGAEVKRFASLPSGYFRERHEAKFKAGISSISTEVA